MSIFDINFNNKALELLPPDKRTPKHVAWMQSLLAPVQTARDKILGQYRTGTTCPKWFGGVYFLGALVKYKGVVYQSLVNAANFTTYDATGATTYNPGQFVNHNAFGNVTYVCLKQTSGAFDATKWAPDAPPSANWIQYLPSFLGTDERVKFNGTKLILEYALNQYFGTNFRQPALLGYFYPADTPGTPNTGDANHFLHSDIFILNNAYEVVGFNVGSWDFLPANWVSGTSYTANLSKVVYGGHVYLCIVDNSSTSNPTINTSDWTDEGAIPANAILTAGVILEDAAYYTDWAVGNYTIGQAVKYQGFVYICMKNTVNEEAPTDTTYWLKIDGIGYLSPFLLGDNFTVYFNHATYNQTNDSEINNFIKKLAYAGVQWSIAVY